VSEQMPEITEAEARVLDELVDLRESDPEGYRALVDEASPDPEKAHADWLLETLSGASKRQQEGAVIDLLNQAWASEAEKNQQ